MADLNVMKSVHYCSFFLRLWNNPLFSYPMLYCSSNSILTPTPYLPLLSVYPLCIYSRTHPFYIIILLFWILTCHLPSFFFMGTCYFFFGSDTNGVTYMVCSLLLMWLTHSCKTSYFKTYSTPPLYLFQLCRRLLIRYVTKYMFSNLSWNLDINN